MRHRACRVTQHRQQPTPRMRMSRQASPIATQIRPYTAYADRRHSAATHLGEQKVPLQLIMAKTRHKNPRTAMRYNRPGGEAVAEITGILAPTPPHPLADWLLASHAAVAFSSALRRRPAPGDLRPPGHRHRHRGRDGAAQAVRRPGFLGPDPCIPRHQHQASPGRPPRRSNRRRPHST